MEPTQLKQEEIVGNEVMFNDISPKTDTSCVNSKDNGMTLSDILTNMWNAINNKQTRTVNSVNKRTGVIELTKEDVGLGKVDNISLTDIKKWVNDQYEKTSRDKRLKLFSTMHEVDEFISTNDKIYTNTPFFSLSGYNSDGFSYIGYIYWDEPTNSLAHAVLPIKLVTQTDDSLIFDENVRDKNYEGGKMGVNIHPDEDVLEIKHGSSKAQSGLKLNKDKLVGTMTIYDGVYGNGVKTDTESLLYFDSASTPQDATTVNIFIDGEQVLFAGLKLRQTDLVKGSMFICNFKDYKTINNAGELVIPDGMCPSLMNRNPAIGRVERVPGDDTYNYTILFYTIKPNTSWGTKYLKTYADGNPDEGLTLQLSLASRFNNPDELNYTNLSGLQVWKGKVDNDINTAGEESSPNDNCRRLILPEGPSAVRDSRFGGVGVMTDSSMCVIPYQWYGPNRTGDTYVDGRGVTKPYGSKTIGNWFVESPNYDDTLNKTGANVLEHACMVGVKLDTCIDILSDNHTDHGGRFRLSNISGLRISRPWRKGVENENDNNLSPKWFGFNNDEECNADEIKTPSLETASHTGGISINVGKFMEITPTNYREKSEDFYDGGKLTVRIGSGLEEEPVVYDYEHPTKKISGNRIQVKVGNGLSIDPATGAVTTNVNPNDFTFDENGVLKIKNFNPTLNILKFVDNYNTEVTYNPLSAEVEGQETDVIKIGKGLKIVTE